ncbi:hypothetical protein H5B63_004472, partial [Salmonella enterica]|nr:hypothetical protein [Salmonella enterica]
MHIPSQRIQNAMSAEEASLWFVPAMGNGDVAFLMKAPSSILKSIINGCSVEFIIGLRNSLIYCAMKIHDISDAPVMITKVLRHEDDISSLIKILEYKTTPIFLFNELDISVSWSNLTINTDTSHLIEKIIKIQHSIARKDPIAVKETHDYFDNLNSNSNTPLNNEFMYTLPFTCEAWTSTPNHFIGITETKAINISDNDEGGNFENTIWASLESVFPYTLHASPKVKIGKKTRELTDILAFYPNASFFIEAKDTSILNSASIKDMQRRTSNLKKQVKKAIGQLVGAVKSTKGGCNISDLNERPIKPVLKRFHCIVLITEMNHHGDWDNITHELLRASSETREYFHLLDLDD